MRRVFAENNDRDIYLVDNNQLAVNDDLLATEQACKAAVEIQKGEAIYSQSNGMPNLDAVWGGTPNLQQFEFFARKQIMKIADVMEVVEFTAKVKDDILQYNAKIKTIYGTGLINGTI